MSALGLAIVGACSAPSHREDTPALAAGSPSSATARGLPLDCNAIGDGMPSPDRLVVLDHLALPARQAPALQTARQPDPTSPVLSYFAKAGLGIRAGSQWRLSVATEARDHLRIGWGSPGTPSTVVLPPATCSPTSRTGWLWYPGGYWTDKPGCYAVVVQADGQSQRVLIGVGAPCPGQEPPAGPSDT